MAVSILPWRVGNNAVRLILNQGNYNFGNPTAFQVGQGPVDLAAGRLDGDALPDLVAVNQTSGTITVLLSTVAPPPPAQIALTVSSRIAGNARLVDLRWSAALSANVDIYRDGSRIATVPNPGSYSDRFSKGTRGTFRYHVCATGGGTCSNEAAITF